jgi:putative flippase GtrA
MRSSTGTDSPTNGVSTVSDDGPKPGGTESRLSPDDQSTLDALLSGTRIGQFLSVGVAGATLETILLTLLVSVFGLPYLVGKAVGAEASITLMFLLNDNWTFEGAADASPLRRWLVGVGVAAAVGQLLVTAVDPELVVAGYDVWPPVANGAGIGVALVVNYVAESLFTWRVTA